MRTLLRLCGFLLLLALLAAGAGYAYFSSQIRIPLAPPQANTFVEIAKGMGTQAIVELLHEKGIIANTYVAMAYVIRSGSRGRLQAGEYLFDRPLTAAEVLDKIAKGDVYLHKFAVPEGLTLRQTADRWQAQGFGSAEDFTAAAGNALAQVQQIDSRAESVEGYLYPETYEFPSHVTAPEAVQTMIGHFRHVIEKLKQEMPEGAWPLDLHRAVILASLVESEAAVDDERPVIASVYLNRLQKNILLQCDPTVIYALERANRYRGRLTLADLKFTSPYNTYMVAGLPPTPITNPGAPSLRAALNPAVTNHIFFVRTEGGRHTFTDTLAAHNQAVAKYRAMMRSRKL